MTRLRLPVVLCLCVLVIPLWTGTARAHTALLGSDPPSGERLAYSPDEVVLSFAAPVDMSTVQAHLRAADGTQIPLESLTPPGPTEIVAFGVPRLSQAVYGMAWESVGDDGHRVSGEVVFGVGTEPGSASVNGAQTSTAANVLDVVAMLARTAWYLVLSLAAGVVVLRRRFPALAGPRMFRWLAATALLRGLVGAVTVLQAGGGPARAFGTRPAIAWGVVALVLMVGAVLVRRVPDGRTSASSGRVDRVTARRLLPVALVAIAVVGGTIAGHAPTRPDPLQAVAFGVVHLGAAALWVGPLLVLALFRPWRGRESSADQAGSVQVDADQAVSDQAAPDQTALVQVVLIRGALADVAKVAGWALAGVVASGALLALRAWEGEGFGQTFTIALIAKSVVVAAVAVPLGILHHRRRERLTSLPPTFRMEVAALVVAVILGSVLVGLDPGWTGSSGSADLALASLLDGTVEDPSDCVDLQVGRAACYRASLEVLMIAEGPQVAIDRIADLQTLDPQMAADCHQVAHDLGNDAAERISDMAIALAVDGSVCWSGYFHGFVEASLAQIDESDMIAQLPSFCDGAADPAYSFTHYNCVHGLGHGLMLQADSQLFAAIPLCEQAGEEWVVRSCASGAFMENIMAAQQGLDVDGLDQQNLLYPCTEFGGVLAEECYLMQTSHILWAEDGDMAAGFGWCSAAPEEYRDTCYRSMGRDISGRSLLDAETVVAECALGSADLQRWCIDGASSNAVYQAAGREEADALCDLVQGDLLVACETARDQALDTIARG